MQTSTSRPSENGALWFFKIFAGLAIVLLMAVHMVVNHMVAPEGLLSWADVVHYYQNPAVVIMEVFFLFFCVSHCLLGLRSIVMDLNPRAGLMRALDGVFIVLGLAAIGYGTWLALTIAAFK